MREKKKCQQKIILRKIVRMKKGESEILYEQFKRLKRMY